MRKGTWIIYELPSHRVAQVGEWDQDQVWDILRDLEYETGRDHEAVHVKTVVKMRRPEYSNTAKQ